VQNYTSDLCTYSRKLIVSRLIPQKYFLLPYTPLECLHSTVSPVIIVYKTDTSPPDIPLLNGDPESDSTNDTITLNISTQKPRGTTDNRLLYILISDKNNKRDSNKFEKFGLKNFQIAANCTLEPSQNSLRVTIGNSYQFDNCYQTNNLPLEPATFYNITVLLLHTFQNKSSHNIYTFMYKTLDTRHKT
jgi:hypothetical protein